MDYKGKDFDDGNRVQQQYAALGIEMAESMVKKVLDQQKHIFR